MKAHQNDIPLLANKQGDRPFIYFDNASTTHKPQEVIDAIITFYTHHNANVGRGVYILGEQSTTLYEQARHAVARFINAAEAAEIVFTSGATDGINIVAGSWAFEHIGPGDEIVVSELEHHANLLPWQRLAHQKGAQLRFISVLSDGALDMKRLDESLNNRTKLVAVTHVSNAVGTCVDIQTIIHQAHRVGAKVLIDAAQSIAHQPIDVQELNPDFLVFSGHKMMGPTGIGVLYVHKSLHDQIIPYQLGGGMVYEASFDYATFLPMPHRLEAGTPPIAQAIGLSAAIGYIKEYIDFNELQKHEARLCTRLIDGLQKLSGVTILGPIDHLKSHGHLVSFVVNGIHAHDVAAYLDHHGIAVRAGHHCAQPLVHKLGFGVSVRVSFYWYNTIEEVDYMLKVMAKLIERGIC